MYLAGRPREQRVSPGYLPGLSPPARRYYVMQQLPTQDPRDQRSRSDGRMTRRPENSHRIARGARAEQAG